MRAPNFISFYFKRNSDILSLSGKQITENGRIAGSFFRENAEEFYIAGFCLARKMQEGWRSQFIWRAKVRAQVTKVTLRVGCDCVQCVDKVSRACGS